MTFEKSDFIQNADLSDGVVPKPCTAVQDLCEENPGLSLCFAEIDTTLFATAIDRLILEVLSTHQLAADIYHGTIYNPRSGQVLKSCPRRGGYLYVAVNLHPAGRNVKLPVHRMIYYAAHPDTILGEEFEIHHIDGNVANNRYENLQKVPSRYHSFIGAFENQVESEAGYLRYLNKRKHGSKIDAYTVKALRVCANQLPYNSKRRAVIYRYFSEQMHVSVHFCKELRSTRAGKSVLPATPEEEKKILKEYAWLIEKARTGAEKQEGAVCTSN